MSRSPAQKLRKIAGHVFVCAIIVAMGTVILLKQFDPSTEAEFIHVTILERGLSRTDSETAARAEPLITVELPDGQTRRLPGLYYALHLELATGCLRRAYGRISGAEQAALVPPESCETP